MGLLGNRGGGKKHKDPGSDPRQAGQPGAAGKRGRGRMCQYGHEVPRGKKMCEHRHWVG